MEVNKNKIYYYVGNVRISIKLSLRRTLVRQKFYSANISRSVRSD
jgi:hypothetical protein